VVVVVVVVVVVNFSGGDGDRLYVLTWGLAKNQKRS